MATKNGNGKAADLKNGAATKAAAARKNAPKVELGDDWHQQETAGSLEGEWLTPAPGMRVVGTLERAFEFEGEKGTNFAVAIRDPKGAVWCISERAAYRDALLATTIGTKVLFHFVKCEPLLDKHGKPTGKKMWETVYATKEETTNETVSAQLERRRKKGQTLPAQDTSNGAPLRTGPGLNASEEVPF